MKNQIARLVAGVATALGLCGGAFASVPWVDPNTGIRWHYELINDNEAEIHIDKVEYHLWIFPSIPKETSGHVDVPGVMDGYPVTCIGRDALASCSGLTSVTIPSSVTNISWNAFKYCTSLVSVVIPEGVQCIEDSAFLGCFALTSVTIPSSVKSIGEETFASCINLTSVTISKGVQSIGTWAFLGCDNLTSVTIPASVERIGEGAFSLCDKLETVWVCSGDQSRIKKMLGDPYEFEGVEFKVLRNDSGRKEIVVPGEKVWIETGMAGYSPKNLPTGLKFDTTAGVITGAATKPTGEDGTKVVFSKRGEPEETLTIIVTAVPKVSVKMEGVNAPDDTDDCKVTGAGVYLVGKKVTLRATAPKGTVFVGWFDDGGVVATQATYSFTMGKEDVALVAKFKKEVMSVGCEALSSKESFPAGVLGAEGGIALDISTESGVKSVKVDKLPSGMKYDTKTGLIIGAPTKAGDSKVVITVTAKSGAVTKKEIEVSVAAMPVMAVGTFSGFVSVGEDNLGTFTLTTTDAGKLTAKVVTAAGTVSFSGTCWDVVEDGVYRATLTTKKGEKLTLTLDSTAGWDENQLVGSCSFVGGRTLDVTAQRNAFGKTWYFAAEGNEKTGWRFAYTDDAKGAALTVTLKADGSTSIAGKLPNGTDAKGKAVTIKVSASGYANVGGLKDGAILADFASVLTVNKVKTVLAIKTNLWFDRKNDHGASVGEAQFIK